MQQPLITSPIAPTRTRHRNNVSLKCQKWSTEEDALLATLVNGHEKINWNDLSKHFPGKSSQQILERWTKVLDPTLMKGSWTRQEDETIINYVKQHGTKSWTKLAELLPGRIGKQCRERWINHLDPDINRGPWTLEEDNKIIELHKQYGNKWVKISALMPHRSDNSIKNRWNSTLSKRAKQMEQQEKINQSISTPEIKTVQFVPTPTADLPRPTLLAEDDTPRLLPPLGINIISPVIPVVTSNPQQSPLNKAPVSVVSPWLETPKTLFTSPLRLGSNFSPTNSLSENRQELLNLLMKQ